MRGKHCPALGRVFCTTLGLQTVPDTAIPPQEDPGGETGPYHSPVLPSPSLPSHSGASPGAKLFRCSLRSSTHSASLDSTFKFLSPPEIHLCPPHLRASGDFPLILSILVTQDCPSPLSSWPFWDLRSPVRYGGVLGHQ